jgi:hypothetical protein
MTRTMARFFGSHYIAFEVTSLSRRAVQRSDVAAREQGERVADWAVE